MDSRAKLHESLCEIININSNGDRHVYFNPPSSVRMKYPAIRYARKKIDKTYANNSVYKFRTAYELTLIDEDPNSGLIEKILQLPYCSHDRHYKTDNLNHDIFTIHV